MSTRKLSRMLEATWLWAFAGLALAVSAQTAMGVSNRPPPTAHLLLAAAGGYLAADFASGFVHFLADTIGSARTPWIGRQFIAPFREHHRTPNDLVGHDFIETNGNNTLIALFVLVPSAWNLHPESGGRDAVHTVFYLTLATFVVLTNQFHKWAHAGGAVEGKPLPRLVRTLQRTRLILHPGHHAQHHRPPYDRHYCTTSGILNPLLDAIGFFSLLRRLTTLRLPVRRRRGPHPS